MSKHPYRIHVSRILCVNILSKSMCFLCIFRDGPLRLKCCLLQVEFFNAQFYGRQFRPHNIRSFRFRTPSNAYQIHRFSSTLFHLPSNQFDTSSEKILTMNWLKRRIYLLSLWHLVIFDLDQQTVFPIHKCVWIPFYKWLTPTHIKIRNFHCVVQNKTSGRFSVFKCQIKFITHTNTCMLKCTQRIHKDDLVELYLIRFNIAYTFNQWWWIGIGPIHIGHLSFGLRLKLLNFSLLFVRWRIRKLRFLAMSWWEYMF